MTTAFAGREGRYSIFRLTEALTCWPALAVMAISYLAAALLMALGGWLAQVSFVFTGLLGLVALLVAVSATSAAGVCLTDLARERPYRSLLSYLMAGLFSLPKLFGAMLLVLLMWLGLLLAMALVLLVCKLPGLGPLLLVVVVPALVVVMAAALIAVYVAASIVGPALWDGEKVMHSLSIAWTITRHHPFAAIGKIVGGFLLSGIFAGLFLGLLVMAGLMVTGVAAPILGMSMQMDLASVMGGRGFGGMGGHMAGAAVGFGLLYAAAMSLVMLLPLMVGVLTWCEFSEKIDLGTIRASTDSALKDVNARVTELKEKAQAAAATAATPPPPPPEAAAVVVPPVVMPPAVMPPAATAPAAVPPAPPVSAPPVSPAPPALAPEVAPTPPAVSLPHCPQCSGVVQVDDRFCEHCGHKLR